MKTPPRALLAPKELELPSGLKVTVLGSPDLGKLIRSGKIPAPLATKAMEHFAAAQEPDFDSSKVDAEQLSFWMEYEQTLVLAVVKTVHYVDEEGTFELPLVAEAKNDNEFPYELLSSEDAAYLSQYAQEGVAPLANFLSDGGSVGNSDDGAEVQPKAKRAPRATKS